MKSIAEKCPLVSQGSCTEIHIDITSDGIVATWWWSKEVGQILSDLGPPVPGFEEVNDNPWCG